MVLSVCRKCRLPCRHLKCPKITALVEPTRRGVKSGK